MKGFSGAGGSVDAGAGAGAEVGARAEEDKCFFRRPDERERPIAELTSFCNCLAALASRELGVEDARLLLAVEEAVSPHLLSLSSKFCSLAAFRRFSSSFHIRNFSISSVTSLMK